MYIFITINTDSRRVETFKLYGINLPQEFDGINPHCLWYMLPDKSGIIPMNEHWNGKTIMVPSATQPTNLDPYLTIFEVLDK